LLLLLLLVTWPSLQSCLRIHALLHCPFHRLFPYSYIKPTFSSVYHRFDVLFCCAVLCDQCSSLSSAPTRNSHWTVCCNLYCDSGNLGLKTLIATEIGVWPIQSLNHASGIMRVIIIIIIFVISCTQGIDNTYLKRTMFLGYKM